MSDTDPNGTAAEQVSSPVDGLPPEVLAAIGGMPDDLPLTPEEIRAGVTLEDTTAQGNDHRGPADEARGSDGTTDDEGGDTSATDDQADTTSDEQVTDIAPDGTDRLADDADLSEYPERVQKLFKTLSRNDRKALLDYADTRAEVRVQTAQEQARALQDKQDKADADAKVIRERVGKFTGEVEAQTPDGRPLPTYSELTKLLQSRRGEDVLDDKFGMSRDEALEYKEQLDQNRELIDGSVGYFDEVAWKKLGYHLEQGLKAIEGINPEAIVTGAAGPHDVVARLAATLTSRFEAEKKALIKSYEGRLESLKLNGQAVAGRAVSGTRAPTTGGRSGGPPKAIPTTVEGLRSLSDADFAAMENDLLARIK